MKEEGEELSLKRFNMKFIIGQGAFGKVKIIEEKKSKQQFALKYINKAQCIKEDCTTLIYRERVMLELLCHPYIVSLRYAFQDDENLFMALELAQGGDLRFSMSKKNSEFDDFTLKVYMAEISSGIAYMHSLYTIHRDLKPENLLLDSKGHILITDLNLATSVKKRKPSSQSGTLDYMAPEMLINEPYSYSIDWWAMGTILFELVYGFLPFDGGSNSDEVKHFIKTKQLVFPEKCRRNNAIVDNPERNNFIKGLLCRDVPHRLGSGNGGLGFESEIKVHPYLKDIDWEKVNKKELEPHFKPNSDKDAMNFAPNLLIEEMLGAGGDPLAYKPRKKKRDPASRTFSQKLTSSFSNLLGIKPKKQDNPTQKKRTKLQVEKEHMDQYWTEFDFEKPDQTRFEMPPRIVYDDEVGSEKSLNKSSSNVDLPSAAKLPPAASSKDVSNTPSIGVSPSPSHRDLSHGHKEHSHHSLGHKDVSHGHIHTVEHRASPLKKQADLAAANDEPQPENAPEAENVEIIVPVPEMTEIKVPAPVADKAESIEKDQAEMPKAEVASNDSTTLAQ